uniref:Tr-type G domain-containing protein n=1 Tax=Globisporangium ultimum (strain ATCC 200006 / CBS 805.95 / DAOM BR144) TaxID=431595 RepID=K3WZG4_GLOUD
MLLALLRRSASSRILPPAGGISANGSNSSLLFTRSLRTTRSGRLRVQRLQQQQQEEEALTLALKKKQKKTPPPAPIYAVPALIRVRDLAKTLKLPVDDVLKKVATRAHRKLHMRWGDNRFEFKNVKQVIVPFEMAQQVAAQFKLQVAYDDVEPQFTTLASLKKRDGGSNLMQRNPVIAVMGHVDHGKTTLLDTLHNSNIAKYEAHSITQKINVSETKLSPDLDATFLDTPGHFHFFRMRTNAAQVADVILLIVAADEGVLLQTEESIGAIEDTGIPVIACINKVDIATPEQIESVKQDLRSFVALQNCPIVEISATTAQNLDALKAKIVELVSEPEVQRKRSVLVAPETFAEGVVLESVAMKGRGTVLRVLLRNGVLKKQDHFVAGMIHGAIRSLRNADGHEIAHAVPGMVVDVIYANKSKNVDAPNEFGFFALPEARAKQVMEQRQLALDFEENLIPGGSYGRTNSTDSDSNEASEQGEDNAVDDDDEDDDLEDLNEDDLIETKSIIVKADTAGSLTSIQDTVDEMVGISTARIGIGNITTKDIDVAINGKCPIFGFNVKLHPKEKKLAASRGVRVILRSTIHGLIEEITEFEQSK